jgi:hypothetical protein
MLGHGAGYLANLGSRVTAQLRLSGCGYAAAEACNQPNRIATTHGAQV